MGINCLVALGREAWHNEWCNVCKIYAVYGGSIVCTFMHYTLFYAATTLLISAQGNILPVMRMSHTHFRLVPGHWQLPTVCSPQAGCRGHRLGVRQRLNGTRLANATSVPAGYHELEGLFPLLLVTIPSSDRYKSYDRQGWEYRDQCSRSH